MLPLLHLSDATRNAELVTIDCGLTASQEMSLSLLLPTSLSGRLWPSLLMRKPYVDGYVSTLGSAETSSSVEG